jgi:hypothetical protein
LLTATAVVGGACAYASNYPPIAKYTAADTISFIGTPVYDLIFEQGGGTFTLPAKDTYPLPDDYTLLSFVDATGAPGVIVYCFGFQPGIVGGEGYLLPSCALYVPGTIDGAGDAPLICAFYTVGLIGGEGYWLPSCASYHAGSIGGELSFELPM